MRQLKQQVEKLSAEVRGQCCPEFTVVCIDTIDASHAGRTIPTHGYRADFRIGILCARLWLPAADAVATIEAMREVWPGEYFPSAVVLLATEEPAEGFWRVPVREPGQSIAAYAALILDGLEVGL